MKASETPDVRPGQVWADNDKRSAGRHVRIDLVDETHASVTTCDAQGNPSPSVLSARRTRIRLDRFRPTATGYRLVKDASEQVGGDSRG